MYAGQTWIVPLGIAGYDAVHLLQRLIFDAKVSHRREARSRLREVDKNDGKPIIISDPIPDIILTVEHAESCFTMGIRDTSAGFIDAALKPLLAPAPLPSPCVASRTPKEWVTALQQRSTPDTLVRRISRGGGITWHGPGQVTMYPIVSIKEAFARQPEAKREPHRGSVMHWWAHTLEECMIDVIVETGEMLDPRVEAPCPRRSHSGVWVGDEKIGFVGVHATDYVTMHGCSLNVTTDAETEFSRVVMCELPDKRATSIARVFREYDGTPGGGVLRGKLFHTPQIHQVNGMLSQALSRHLKGQHSQTVVAFSDVQRGMEAIHEALHVVVPPPQG